MKATVDIPDDLKVELERIAAAEQRSEDDIIRQALADYVWPRPALPYGHREGLPADLSVRVDEFMDGFGEQ